MLLTASEAAFVALTLDSKLIIQVKLSIVSESRPVMSSELVSKYIQVVYM